MTWKNMSFIFFPLLKITKKHFLFKWNMWLCVAFSSSCWSIPSSLCPLAIEDKGYIKLQNCSLAEISLFPLVLLCQVPYGSVWPDYCQAENPIKQQSAISLCYDYVSS